MRMKCAKWLKYTAIAGFIASMVGNAQAQEEPPLFVYDSTNNIGPRDITSTVAPKALNLEKGSVTLRVRNVAPNASRTSSFGTFMGVTSSREDRSYLWFYSRLDTDGTEKIGLEIRNNNQNLVSNDQLLSAALPRNLGEYRTVTYTFDKEASQIKIYVDGVLQSTATSSKFFSDVQGLDRVAVGTAIRSQPNPLIGHVLYADISNKVLTSDEVREKHQALLDYQAFTQSRREMLGAEKSEKYEIFKPDQHGARNYRIPSLFTTQKGTVIAGIDKRHDHAGDWGNIDTVIRRSLDGGKTWEDDQVVLDLASQPYNNGQSSAFLIDPLMVQDKRNDRIFMLVDMFPEMRGLFGFGSGAEPDGTGYKNINGKQYRVLTDAAHNQYTVRENGVVYDENHQATEYRVVVEGNRDVSFKDLGDLYHGETRVGNIFLNSQGEGNDSAPLMAKKTSHLWLTYSDDEGKTWSNPVDITPQVKADWMQFMGAGPGNGIQLKNGNLVMPVYYTNNVGKLEASQTAAVIISRDGGVTWERGEAPTDRWEAEAGGSRLLNRSNKQTTESQLIELDNGELKMFSRNKMSNKVVISTSKDGGYTWTNDKQIDGLLWEPYSQLSVIKYSKRINGKEVVLFANPHSTNRSNGKVWLGEVQDDGTIAWKYSTDITVGTPYSYNSLTELPNGDIGLLYEETQGQNVQYVRLNIQELVWHDNLVYRDSRNTTNKEVNLNDGTAQTYYKIGDGEMVQIGVGENPSHLVVEEGVAVLNQQADENNQKQAFASVTVNQAGTARLGSADQVNLSHLTLNKGTLDLNGQTIELDDSSQPATGLRAAEIDGNLVNHSEQEANLSLRLNGERTIHGKLGDEKGKLNFNYTPTEKTARLSLEGHSVLNVLNVENGTISYAPNTTHQAQSVNVSAGNLILNDGVVANLGKTTLDKLSNFIVNNPLKDVKLEANISGAGNFVKTGAGALQINGELNHSGLTKLEEGRTELNGVIRNGLLMLGNRATLGGNGQIEADSIWAKDAVIEPGVGHAEGEQGSAQDKGFEAKTLSFANVRSLGANLRLRINNIYQNMQSWEHDQVVINGDVSTAEPNRVEARLMGTEKGVSDTNNNGKYDADEGLSLIQVKGKGEVGQFVLDKTTSTSGQDVSDLFQFTLVSVDKKVNGNDYYDYRLQNLLIDENGNSPEAVIRYVEPVKEEQESEDVVAPQPSVQPSTPIVTTVTTANETTSVSTPVAAVVTTNESTPASTTVSSVATVNEAPLPVPTPTPAPTYRAAVNSAVPSHLTASLAMYNQGDYFRRQFMGNLHKHDEKGLYVSQQHGNSRYHSDLAFADYGYDFKATQNSTLFGGYLPLGERSEVHLGVGFGKQNVNPQAVDGWSETRYKSTALLAGLHNQWGNTVLNLGLGYQFHKGKIASSETKNSGSIKGKQFQASAEVGYQIPIGDLTLTPVAGITYQQVKAKAYNLAGNWKVDFDKFNLITNHIGTNLNWKNDKVSLNVGAFYEHQHSRNGKVAITAAQQADFKTGKVGDALAVKAKANVALTKQLFLEVGLEHRKALGKAKLDRTQVHGKLEYRF